MTYLHRKVMHDAGGILVAVCILLLISGNGLCGVGASDEGNPIDFLVVNSRDSLPLAGVDVFVLSTEGGVILVGTTGEDGRASVNRGDISKPDALAILFCTEGFFSGAFRIVEDHVLEYDERLIHLAPFAFS